MRKLVFELCVLIVNIFAVASTSAAPQQLQRKDPYTIKAANGAFDMTAASKKQVWKNGAAVVVRLDNCISVGPGVLGVVSDVSVPCFYTVGSAC